MRFFEQHVSNGKSDLFYKLPTEFTKNSEKELLRYCVGAALYMPATREQVADEIIARKHLACTSIILDLEDAIGQLQLESGELQLQQTLQRLQRALELKEVEEAQIPLLFVRARNAEHLARLAQQLGNLQHLLTGYVLPKFTMQNGEAYLREVAKQNDLGYALFAMPILESKEIIQRETRLQELMDLSKLFTAYETMILNIRLGSTDFCGTLGLRRSINQTIYDVITVQQCFADIINIFTRAEASFIISGSVWEYFGSAAAERGLLREVQLDCLNGLVGKTIIHPTHLEPVQAIYAVSHEEYMDATKVLSHAEGEIGVEKSAYNNKMNEMKPHFVWAQRILSRAQAFGVLKAQYSAQDLLMKKVNE